MLGVFYRINPDLSKDVIRQKLFDLISAQYEISETYFNDVWAEVDKTGLIDQVLEKKKKETGLDLSDMSLSELEGMISDDLIKNNMLALEMIKHPNFNRGLVNESYNGLGVEIKMGKEGAYGKGQILKRALNLQQFYTNTAISKIMKKMLEINDFARVYDPTCGSGRLFFHMPNPKMCHGIEIEHDAYSIARALYPEAQIIQDSTMYHIPENEFDYIIANPPFTLYWEDRMRIFKNVGYNNKIVSEAAIFEIAVRSLRNNGYFAVIMPSDVWLTKFIDKIDLIDWLKSEIDPIAKIELPTTTHEGTVWPTALFIFRKTTQYSKSGWMKGESRLPDWQFTHKLESYEDSEINNLIDLFKKTDLRWNISEYSNGIQNQAPFELKPETIVEFSEADYLKSATKIESLDIVILDALLEEIDSFTLPPVTLEPNGLHADLKINAFRSEFPIKWSASRKGYFDPFREQISNLDQFLDERKVYDTLPLVQGLHSKDVIVEHSPGFMDALSKRKEWIKFQDVPFEIAIDEEQDFTWKTLYQDQGYLEAYPDIWSKWEKRFIELQQDSQYNTYLSHLDREDNWIKHLFNFQKFDVMRLAMKASAIHAGTMGLGKTRTSIATALLKGFANNLLVCQARVVHVWMEEFEELGLPPPYLVQYDDDIIDMMNHEFVIVSYETLRHAKSKPRPEYVKKKKSNPGSICRQINPGDALQYTYDAPSRLDFEEGITDMMGSMGFAEEESIDLGFEMESNPKKTAEGEETKAQQQIRELQTRPLFADHFTEKFGMMIVDEAHKLSNPITLQTQAVWRLTPKHMMFLTGTPIQNRVKGLLSLLVIGWGEETTANPYSKASFLEHFMQKINVEYEVADAHGYISTKDKEVEIPQIANPDDLRTLMAGKWLRRTKYEPDVAADRKFPKPFINFREIEPSEAEKAYAKQWYDELQGLKAEIQVAKEELSTLRDRRKSYGISAMEEEELDRLEKELRTKVAITVIMIGKLRAVALAPQIDWLGKKTSAGDEEELTALQKTIDIPIPYKGGMTPRQEIILEDLIARVKKGEQCYTIVDFPQFNRQLLKPWLVKEGIRVEIIDGAVAKKRRDEIIRNFRNQKVDIILATIGTFDVGINIPAASYCAILMPSWNWSDMEQAFNRMIRPQSKGERTVDIFYSANTIETYVRQLVEMKKFNQEYVIDFGPRPPDQKWFSWTDAVEAMFVDIQRGDFNVS